MSTEMNKAVVRRFMDECITAQDAHAVGDFFVEDFVWHGMHQQGIELLTQHVLHTFEAFPDANPVVEDQIAEGDMVATRYTVTSTFAQDWYGVEATGKTATRAGMVICRLSGGKIAEWWMVEDVLSMWQQFGALSQLVTQDDAAGD